MTPGVCLAAFTAALVFSVPAARSADVLLFSFFRDNGQDGLYFAWSSDGLAWTELKPPGKSFLDIYFDHYAQPQYYGATQSRDFQHWQDVSDRLRFPRGARHGTVLKVPEAVVRRLETAARTR